MKQQIFNVSFLAILFATTSSVSYEAPYYSPPSDPVVDPNNVVEYPMPNKEQQKVYWRTEIHKDEYRCEKLSIKTCKTLGYNYTMLPNVLGHIRQVEAQMMLNGFQLLIDQGCSRRATLFLCMSLAPTCDDKGEYLKPIGPCRGICRRVEKECRATVESFQFPWPEWLDCSQFVEENAGGGSLCMEEPAYEDEGESETAEGNESNVNSDNRRVGDDSENTASSSSSSTTHSEDSSVCKPFQFFLKSANACVTSCGYGDESGEELRHHHRRHHGRFGKEEKVFMEKWMIGWSSICFICTLFAVGTYFLDQSRFKYPERPVIFISLCYLIMSGSVFLRLILGREQVSCEQTTDGHRFLIQDGLSNTGCTIVFLLYSYFNTASYVWWVVLTCSWFFAAGLKWTQEAIGEKSSYFHSFAWGIPSIQTVLIMANRHVDGDELTGMCNAGSQDPEILAKFVIAPLCTFLFTGFMVVVLGCISLFRVKSYMQKEGSSTVKLEKLMFKIIIFAAFYVVTTGIVMGCYGYEVSHEREIARKIRKYGTSSLTYIQYTRFAMQLFTGVVAGGWVLSFKTIHSWRSCLRMIMVIIPDSDQEEEVDTESISWNHHQQPAVKAVTTTITTQQQQQQNNNNHPVGDSSHLQTCSEASYSGDLTSVRRPTYQQPVPIEQLCRPLLLSSDTSNRTDSNVFKP